MRIIGYLFAGFLILAVFQAALTVLTYWIIAYIVIGLITRPWETIGTLTAVVVLGMVSRYPLPGAAMVLALFVIGLVNPRASAGSP